jgi:hypothetical protein
VRRAHAHETTRMEGRFVAERTFSLIQWIVGSGESVGACVSEGTPSGALVVLLSTLRSVGWPDSERVKPTECALAYTAVGWPGSERVKPTECRPAYGPSDCIRVDSRPDEWCVAIEVRIGHVMMSLS